jgi:hypothetical protein
MSKENIVEQKKLPSGNLLVTFETRDGEEHTYVYSKTTGRKIARGADPARFKGKEQ